MTVTLEAILWGYCDASRLVVLALESGSYQVAVENEEQKRFRVVDGEGEPLSFSCQSDVVRQFQGLAILDILTESYPDPGGLMSQAAGDTATEVISA